MIKKLKLINKKRYFFSFLVSVITLTLFSISYYPVSAANLDGEYKTSSSTTSITKDLFGTDLDIKGIPLLDSSFNQTAFGQNLDILNPPLIRIYAPNVIYVGDDGNTNLWTTTGRPSDGLIDMSRDPQRGTFFVSGGEAVILKFLPPNLFQPNQHYRLEVKLKGNISPTTGYIVRLLGIKRKSPLWWCSNSPYSYLQFVGIDGNFISRQGQLTNIRNNFVTFTWGFDVRKEDLDKLGIFRLQAGLSKASSNEYVSIDSIRIYQTQTGRNILQEDFKNFHWPLFSGKYPNSLPFTPINKKMLQIIANYQRKKGTLFILPLSLGSLQLAPYQGRFVCDRNILNYEAWKEISVTKNSQQWNSYLRMVKNYITDSKDFSLNYFDFNSEPELTWDWLSSRLAAGQSCNYGVSSSSVQTRYQLYGYLYALLANQLQPINPNIKFGAYIYTGKYWKESFQAFWQALSKAGVTALPPYFWTPHTYLAFAWGSHGLCSRGGYTCDDNQFSQKNRECLEKSLHSYDQGVRCDLNKIEITNTANEPLDSTKFQTYNFQQAFYQCSQAFLKRYHHYTTVRFIPTEWGSSGSAITGYQSFGYNFQVAKMLGIYAQLGLAGAAHFTVEPGWGTLSLYGRLNAPFFLFSLLNNQFNAQKNITPYTLTLQSTPTTKTNNFSLYLYQQDQKFFILAANANSQPFNFKLVLPHKEDNYTLSSANLICPSFANCFYQRGKDILMSDDQEITMNLTSPKKDYFTHLNSNDPDLHYLQGEGAIKGLVKKQSLKFIKLEPNNLPSPPPTVGDTNNNQQTYDRGDVICAISAYLQHPGESIDVSHSANGKRYDVDNNNFFNRQDVIKFIIHYLLHPLNAAVGRCLPLEN